MNDAENLDKLSLFVNQQNLYKKNFESFGITC